ncbi:hypothetical protein ACFP51_12600 [Streptomyces pratens]|uniref:Uncharacterized protein n=1 Tax=Streptomyces pratens TaxID=887456 RepID=A0ABW1M8E9_9ACTN
MIVGEIEARAVEDARRRQDEQQARAERELRWQAAMGVAKEQAVREQLAQLLCEEAGCWQGAAQTAKRSPEFAAAYQRLAHRRGKKIATTAVARRLLARAYYLLREVESAQERR